MVDGWMVGGHRGYGWWRRRVWLVETEGKDIYREWEVGDGTSLNIRSCRLQESEEDYELLKWKRTAGRDPEMAARNTGPESPF
jgi:hypothetical protein